jgi:hypothetical protein
MHRHIVSGLAVAAALLILAVPVALYVGTTSQAKAAQAELVSIHFQNLRAMDGGSMLEDAGAVGDYGSDKTDQALAMACMGSDLSICGCSVGQFRGRPVASYVVRTKSGLVSIVALSDRPKSLRLVPARGTQESERPLWRARCEDCHIASIRSGDRFYYAIGQVPPKELGNVLHHLVQ